MKTSACARCSSATVQSRTTRLFNYAMRLLCKISRRGCVSLLVYLAPVAFLLIADIDLVLGHELWHTSFADVSRIELFSLSYRRGEMEMERRSGEEGRVGIERKEV